MITTGEALTRWEARGMEVSYPNLALWVRSGEFKGARQERMPRGPVWMIVAASVESLEPPKRGRVPEASKKGGKQ